MAAERAPAFTNVLRFMSGLFLANRELVSCPNGLAILEIDFQEFFALHVSASFILQYGHDFPRGDIDHVAGGRISDAAVNAECYPAWLIPQLDAADLLWRHDGSIKNVHALVRAIGDPEFLFVWREPDAVAGAAMAFHGTFLEAFHFDAVQLLAGFNVADFEAEQFVNADEAQGLAAVHSEWADGRAERANGPVAGVSGGIGDGEPR